MFITSLDNEKVRFYEKLKDKKERDKTGLFMVEGAHLVLEAHKQGLIKELLLEKDEVFPIDIPKEQTVYLTEQIIKKISSVESPQKVMAVCYKKKECEELGDKILILDNVQDPGNVGTIIRSACAFNIDTVVFSPNSVDLYNPKTIRATQGMFFHMNCIRRDLMPILEALKKEEIPIYGTLVGYGDDVREIEDEGKKRFALVVGNEGNGVEEGITNMCDKNLYIDTNSNVESLNVAIATSILLYELGSKVKEKN